MGGGGNKYFFFPGKTDPTIDYQIQWGLAPTAPPPPPLPFVYACRVSTDSNSGNCTHISLVILNAQKRHDHIWKLKMARIGL